MRWTFSRRPSASSRRRRDRDVVAVMMPAESEAAWNVNFWVDDADATAERTAELGGHVVVPPFDSPVGRDAVFADPDGAVFSVTRIGPPA